MISGADNGTNRANCDTRHKHQIWHECSLGATGQICPMGHLKIQDGGHFFKMAAIFTRYRIIKKIKCICLVDFSDLNFIVYILPPS